MTSLQESSPWAARAGWALFRARGWVPVPLLVVTVILTGPITWTIAASLLFVGVGLAIRLWAVSHIGPGSRTRTDEVHKLVYTGPYELSRNPLYVANLVLYGAIGGMAGHPYWASVLLVVMFVHYSLIVRWEEWNLERRLGEVFRSYRNRVPRWLGSSAPVHASAPREHVDSRWARAWQSERSTWIAVAVCVAAIVIRGGLAGA